MSSPTLTDTRLIVRSGTLSLTVAPDVSVRQAPEALGGQRRKVISLAYITRTERTVNQLTGSASLTSSTITWDDLLGADEEEVRRARRSRFLTSGTPGDTVTVALATREADGTPRLQCKAEAVLVTDGQADGASAAHGIVLNLSPSLAIGGSVTIAETTLPTWWSAEHGTGKPGDPCYRVSVDFGLG